MINSEINIYQKLNSQGFSSEQEFTERKTISVSEKGKKYRLELQDKLPSVVFSIDGNIIKEGNKCDKLILLNINTKSNKWVEIFVELKGSDISHAIKQLETTISNIIFKCSSVEGVKARIVASSYPANSSNPILEKAKVRFCKKYKCELKGLKSHQPDRFIPNI